MPSSLSNGYSRAFIWPVVQDIWFTKDDECCWNFELDIFGGSWPFWIVFTNFQNENSRDFEYNLVDVFLRFPTNICMSHADKPNNGYGHWKTARGKKFDENLEIDWFLEDGRRFSSRMKPR
jgi:hypothetical protein